MNAEREGFEPPLPKGKPHFECGAFSQTLPPLQKQRIKLKLAPRLKKVLNQTQAPFFQYAPFDGDLYFKAGVAAKLVQGTTTSLLFIVTTKYDLFQAGIQNRTGTHGAWFFGHIQCAVLQPPAFQSICCCRNRNHLGMGGWIVQGLPLIVTPTDNFTLTDHDSTHWYFSCFKGPLCLHQGLFHPARVTFQWTTLIIKQKILQ